ncbi:unnamed protein product [Pleuronectes platessa]|uniref:Uncharacterized protein n=1 Tax=Pleuronectes platessa TaxID=8262 RepID=A0A9N7TU27_PLEPL|nr:unnamed protein product [Pleuronectes platessa]
MGRGKGYDESGSSRVYLPSLCDVVQTKAASMWPQSSLRQDCKHCDTTKGEPSPPVRLSKSHRFYQLTPGERLSARVPSAPCLPEENRLAGTGEGRHTEAERRKTYCLVV